MSQVKETTAEEAKMQKPSMLTTLKQTTKDSLYVVRDKAIRLLGGVPANRKDSNLVSHAITEMNTAWPEQDDMQDAVKQNIVDLVSVLSHQGHSGFSAPYVIGLFEQLARFKPLGPLTGNDEEWVWLHYSPDMVAQNKRFSSVFRRADGTAYNIDGRVFYEKYIHPDGEESWIGFTSNDSKVDITFPYTPQTERVYLDQNREVISVERETN